MSAYDLNAWLDRVDREGLDKIRISAACLDCGKMIPSEFDFTQASASEQEKFCKCATWEQRGIDSDDIADDLLKAHGLDTVDRVYFRPLSESTNEI